MFSIKVWSSLNPETVIYQESAQRPAYTSVINGYATYVLDQIVPVSGTIYIGFQQVLGDGLHLGYDRNTASNSRMFYNVGAGWIQSAITPGTFMMRPVMGDTTLFVGVPEENPDNYNFTVAPNPADGLVNFIFSKSNGSEQLEVWSVDGRLVHSSSLVTRLETSAFSPGVYIVRVRNQQAILAQRRLIISR